MPRHLVPRLESFRGIDMDLPEMRAFELSEDGLGRFQGYMMARREVGDHGAVQRNFLSGAQCTHSEKSENG